MELEESLLLLIIVLITGVCIGLGVILTNKIQTKFNKYKQRQRKESLEESNIDIIVSGFNNSVDILKSNLELSRTENKSLLRANAKLKGLSDKTFQDEKDDDEEYELENLQQNYDIDVSKASALLKTMNLNIPMIDNILKDPNGLQNLLTNPLTSGMVWKQIEKNIEVIMPTGILVPKGQLSQQQPGSTTNSNESSQQVKPATDANGQLLGTA